MLSFNSTVEYKLGCVENRVSRGSTRLETHYSHIIISGVNMYHDEWCKNGCDKVKWCVDHHHIKHIELAWMWTWIEAQTLCLELPYLTILHKNPFWSVVVSGIIYLYGGRFTCERKTRIDLDLGNVLSKNEKGAVVSVVVVYGLHYSISAELLTSNWF